MSSGPNCENERRVLVLEDESGFSLWSGVVRAHAPRHGRRSFAGPALATIGRTLAGRRPKARSTPWQDSGRSMDRIPSSLSCTWSAGPASGGR
jgi:hypothetical protein